MLLNIDLSDLQLLCENPKITLPGSLSSAQAIRICITANHLKAQACKDLLSTLGDVIVDNFCKILHEIKTLHPTVTISRITVDPTIQLYCLKQGIFETFLNNIKSADVGCQVFEYEKGHYTSSLLNLFLLKGDDTFKIHVGEKETAVLYGQAEADWEQGVTTNRFGNYPDLVKNDEHEAIEEIAFSQEGRAKRKNPKREEETEVEGLDYDSESSESSCAIKKRPKKITTPLLKGLSLSAEESEQLKNSILHGSYKALFHLRPKQIATFCREHQLDGLAETIIHEKRKNSTRIAAQNFRLKEKLERNLKTSLPQQGRAKRKNPKREEETELEEFQQEVFQRKLESELKTPSVEENWCKFFSLEDVDLTGVDFSQEQENTSQSGTNGSGFFSR